MGEVDGYTSAKPIGIWPPEDNVSFSWDKNKSFSMIDLPWEQALLSLPCPSCQYYSQSIQTAKFKYNMKRGSRRKENKSGIGNRSRALVEGKKRGE